MPSAQTPLPLLPVCPCCNSRSSAERIFCAHLVYRASISANFAQSPRFLPDPTLLTRLFCIWSTLPKTSRPIPNSPGHTGRPRATVKMTGDFRPGATIRLEVVYAGGRPGTPVQGIPETGGDLTRHSLTPACVLPLGGGALDKRSKKIRGYPEPLKTVKFFLPALHTKIFRQF